MEFGSFRGAWSLMSLLYKLEDVDYITNRKHVTRITSFSNVAAAMSAVSRYGTTVPGDWRAC